MSNPLHAKYYADQAVQRSVQIVENVRLARDTYRVRFECAELASRILPGQFLMLRIDANDPLIGRPLALYDVVEDGSGRRNLVDVVYLVKGKLTTRLADSGRGTKLHVWGPLGNGFQPIPTSHLIMVAGGIGQTPFLALAKEYFGIQKFGTPQRDAGSAQQLTLCYGARSADFLAGVEDFQKVGVHVHLATDDGSRGYHGFVTQLLEQVLKSDEPDRRIVCCGPEPMMHAVARIAAASHASCQVSLETPMACGVGICFTCVAKVRDASGDWDYKRTCVEGPVFDADLIDWD